MKDRFLFFENFKKIADTLPDDLRLKFYDALTAYVFDDEEPENPVIKSLIIAIKPSLDKEEKRGGNHNPAGQNQHSKDKQNNIEVKDGQKNNSLGQKEVKVGQSGQSFLETETGNKKQKNDNNKLLSQKKFVRPTCEEVAEYCRERKNDVNPEKFVDFYASKGWMIGKTPMKDWKAAVRTWEQRQNSDPPEMSAEEKRRQQELIDKIFGD